MTQATDAATKTVRHFRQILLWPLQLIPIREESQLQNHRELLLASGPDNPWHEVDDEITGDPAAFQERHYSEFVSFLPHVQRFLYGEGRMRQAGRESPIHVFRRRDIAAVRTVLRAGSPPLVLQVAHCDLYFFYDIDVVVLAFELYADGLSMETAQDALYRLGRAYPPHWLDDGSGKNCPQRVEWLTAAGEVLAASDYERRDRYLSSVCRNRAPQLASHWEFLLHPLVPDYSDDPGRVRYRLVEFYRMPLMGYLSFDDPRTLSRSDFVRLGLVTAAGTDESSPYAERYLWDFEQRVCYDRYWTERGDRAATRFMCCGYALVVVGEHAHPLFTDAETGVLGQFRHQHFLLFLIAHFHKAALLMLSDRLVVALNRLDIHDPNSVKRFKRTIRQIFEIFLRFTHRYWFHEISDQAQIRDLFRMCAGHLGTDRLFAEVRDEIQDMSDYLDSDSLRRQANTVVRLTVITTFGLIATIATGFLGMNVFAEADASPWAKIGYFLLVVAPTAGLVLLAMLKSKKLSDFLEALSDERLPARAKVAAWREVWRPTPAGTVPATGADRSRRSPRAPTA